MNTTAIVLAILVIILIYVLYRFFSLSSTELIGTASLTGINPDIKIANSPTSTRYSYGIWIYVNSWDTSIAKAVYGRDDNIRVYFDKVAPILKCDIHMNSGEEKTIEITDAFPLQKWTHIIVSVDNQYVDTYIDGKLVSSSRVYAETEDSAIDTPKVPNDNPMRLGAGTQYDAYVSKFKHWNVPVNPEIAWSSYMEGNGDSSIKNIVSSYGVDLSILKDNVEQTKFRVF